MATFNLETAWDTNPDSTSTYEIYDSDDQWIKGNAVDPTQKYDLATFTDLEGGAPKGSLLIVYKSRLMIAGNEDYPHRVFYSHLNNGEGWSPDDDWIDIYPEDGGSINSLDIQGDELIVCKDNGRTYGWRIFDDGDPTYSRLRVIEDDKGNAGRKASTVMEDIKYYLDRSGGYTVPASEKGGWTYIIQEVIKGISADSYPDVAVGSNDGKVYVSVGDVSFDLYGETISLTDAVIVLDTINRAISLRDNMNARVFTRFIDSLGAEDLYFGSDDAKVFKVDDGTKAGEASITMRVRTKPFFIGDGRKNTISKIGVHMIQPDNTQVMFRTNLEDSFRELGVVTESPVQWFEPKSAKGGIIQLEFQHSGSVARPTLMAYSFIYDEQGRK